ncbi:Tetratricopeptide repeat (TPR)-like superfamily protein [Raphanus sativus]|nr:Tetratricopeptide repeat (TPR)-like superfamily protein [Raphanus sativus]
MARRAFDLAPSRNVVSWTVMISAYAINGLPERALASFEEMKREGYTKRGDLSGGFISLLSWGIDQARSHVLQSMVEDHNKPSLQHYSCLVDMLSRAGEIDTAVELIKNLPEDMKPGVSAWGSILSGCRTV